MVAVLVIGFNRPDLTIKLFKHLSSLELSALYFAVDGPRDDDTEKKIVKETQQSVHMVQFDFPVYLRFRDSNVGCEENVLEAISWFFDNEDFGVIIEDDCFPSASFFDFCVEMDRRYRGFSNISMISGNNHISTPEMLRDGDYHFSKHGSIWGWATWGSVWRKYQGERTLILASVLNRNSWVQRKLRDNTDSIKEYFFWIYCARLVDRKKVDTWDVHFAIWRKISGLLTIRPSVNMVRNDGLLHEKRTNTNSSQHVRVENQCVELYPPYRSCERVQPDEVADQRLFRKKKFGKRFYVEFFLWRIRAFFE